LLPDVVSFHHFQVPATPVLGVLEWVLVSVQRPAAAVNANRLMAAAEKQSNRRIFPQATL
jgi:hypothetical protein